jgi:hypothetical protein
LSSPRAFSDLDSFRFAACRLTSTHDSDYQPTRSQLHVQRARLDTQSSRRTNLTGHGPTIRLSFAIVMSRPSVAPSTGQQHDVTRFNCNGSSQKQALGHNDDSDTRRRLNVHTCMPMTPSDTLSRTTILTRLRAPHLGTTSPINDHPSPAYRRQLSPPPSCSIEYDHPLTCGRCRTRHLHLVAPSTDNRSPRGASTGRLPGASITSNPRPRSDTNC